MGATRQLQRSEWQTYFEQLMRRHLAKGAPAATIDVLLPDLGDQREVTKARLDGIDYDPKSNALEVAFEDLDHLVYHPTEVWVLEEDDGFVSALEVVRADETKEILQLQRGGAPEPAHAGP
jgi:hypothetical protein